VNHHKRMGAILSLAAVAAAIVLAGVGCGKQTPSLSLLVWEGYADPSYVRAFEESHHCKISASYMGSSDELVAKLRGGSASNYDVISPSSDVATMIAASGLAAPLDLSKLPAYPQLSERLRNMPLVRVNGNVYGVPFTWGPNPLLYDTTYFAKPPDSWAVLWDPKLKGKISAWDELSTMYMAAQVLGYDQPDPNHIYNLSDAELDNVRKKLIELKPNIRKFWSTGGELTNLFENHEIVAEGDYAHGCFSGHGRRRSWIAADIVRFEDGKLAGHWDVLQDEAAQAESLSGLSMFGDRFPGDN